MRRKINHADFEDPRNLFNQAKMAPTHRTRTLDYSKKNKKNRAVQRAHKSFWILHRLLRDGSAQQAGVGNGRGGIDYVFGRESRTEGEAGGRPAVSAGVKKESNFHPVSGQIRIKL